MDFWSRQGWRVSPGANTKQRQGKRIAGRGLAVLTGKWVFQQGGPPDLLSKGAQVLADSESS